MSRFCTECHTPWALRAVYLDDAMIIRCKQCGHIRATVLSQRHRGTHLVADGATVDEAARLVVPATPVPRFR